LAIQHELIAIDEGHATLLHINERARRCLDAWQGEKPTAFSMCRMPRWRKPS
jgi:hypothetical protein